MAEDHWRVVSSLDGRILIDKTPDGTSWKTLGEYDTQWFDLAFAPDGKLYGLDADGALQSIDPETGVATIVGATGVRTPNGMVVDALGNAYVSNSRGSLYSIDLATGETSRVGKSLKSEGDLEFHKGELWLAAKGNVLAQIDPETGEVIDEFEHDVFNLVGLTSTADGFLGYAGNKIYEIDVEEQTLTQIGKIKKVDFFLGADSLPVDYYLTATETDVALTGSADVNLRGNSRANVLSGNSGDNTLSGAAGNDTLLGRDGNNRLFGGVDNDILKGGTGRDRLFGGVDNDILKGGTGRDRLEGGSGKDTLLGGRDADKLKGGEGPDTFRFTDVTDSQPGSNQDVILDFNRREDAIDLSAIDAKPDSVRDNAFKYIGSDDFDGNAGRLRFENNLLEADLNGDGLADFAVELANVRSLPSDVLIL